MNFKIVRMITLMVLVRIAVTVGVDVYKLRVGAASHFHLVMKWN